MVLHVFWSCLRYGPVAIFRLYLPAAWNKNVQDLTEHFEFCSWFTVHIGEQRLRKDNENDNFIVKLLGMGDW